MKAELTELINKLISLRDGLPDNEAKQPIIVHIPEEWMWKPVMERIEKIMPLCIWHGGSKPTQPKYWEEDHIHTCIMIECKGRITHNDIFYYQQNYHKAPILTVSQFMKLHP